MDGHWQITVKVEVINDAQFNSKLWSCLQFIMQRKEVQCPMTESDSEGQKSLRV